METVTISPKFQVVIPQAVREALKLLPGEKMRVLHEQTFHAAAEVFGATHAPTGGVLAVAIDNVLLQLGTAGTSNGAGDFCRGLTDISVNQTIQSYRRLCVSNTGHCAECGQSDKSLFHLRVSPRLNIGLRLKGQASCLRSFLTPQKLGPTPFREVAAIAPEWPLIRKEMPEKTA